MHKVFAYCGKPATLKEIERSLRDDAYLLACFLDPKKLISAVRGERPDIVVLHVSPSNHWTDADFDALRESCGDARIIYATPEPGLKDAEILEKGIFYYAGNASSQELLAAVRAALTNRNKSGGNE